MVSLDLFSTSQNGYKSKRKPKEKTDRRIYDECLNNAPYFAYHIEGKKWGVVQGCCNDWNCPRCGQQRAKEEYGRIVAGTREMGKDNQLYMLTITCRGKEMSYEEAENGYLIWTNRLLSRLRAQTKCADKTWAYASVTERQDRMHPHSHYLTTYCPPDAIFVEEGWGKTYFTQGKAFPAKHKTIQSAILEYACFECGLGWQYDLSRLDSVEGASRYVAKYLFKETIFTTKWPKGWKRVRYSRNWPKLPDVRSDAFILLNSQDWYRLSREALIIKTQNDGVAQVVRKNLYAADVIVQ